MLTFCSVQDPDVHTPAGYNTKTEASVWSCSGRIQLDVPKYVLIYFNPVSFYDLRCYKN